MQPYRGVVGRYLLRLSEPFYRRATEVNLFNRGAILALKVAGHVSDAGAGCLRNLSLLAEWCFGSERLLGAVRATRLPE